MPRNSAKPSVSRREVFQAAGGFTLLSLLPAAARAETPVQAGHSNEPARAKARPVFTALPYLQPGPASALKDGEESIVIAWQTNGVKGEYALTYDGGRKAEINTRTLKGGAMSEGEQRINHFAVLDGLKLGKRYDYRVTLDGEPLLDGHFTTRKPRGAKIRFVTFGDNSYGDISDRATAYYAYKAMPDFVMNTGDNVYESGLDNEYARHFFPVYNADEAGPRTGAPLLRAVPFYTTIANHDVHGKNADGPAADFTKDPDALGYYTAMHLPGNGPALPSHPTPIVGPEATLAVFKTVAGDRYPRQANYSFDVGDAHFTVLDANVYVDPTDSALQKWVEDDLKGTDAIWKFVVYHHPAFNVGHEHYAAQHMRVLSPLFERCGVDVCFHGHEHVYQRTRPFRFRPTDESGAKEVGKGKRLVPGEFAVDRAFDGDKATKPNGIVYITTGAGGKHLYDPDQNGAPGSWLHEEDRNADYNARFVSDRHSLTVVDLDAKTFTLRQVDEWGGEIDRIVITKP